MFILTIKWLYKIILFVFYYLHMNHPYLTLIAVRQTTHSTHHAEYIVIASVDPHLCRVDTCDRRVRENELEGGVINTGEVAGARWLVLLRLERE